MPAYSFMSKFVPPILGGSKPHTIRGIRKDGVVPEVGQPFVGYCSMRQPTCTWLFTSEIVKVESVRIERDPDGGAPIVRLTPATVSPDWLHAPILALDKTFDLILADGFTGADGFRDHFVPNPGDIFTGHLIHWKPEDAVRDGRHDCPACGELMPWRVSSKAFVCECDACMGVPHYFKRPEPNV